jgi:hypothetical protein
MYRWSSELSLVVRAGLSCALLLGRISSFDARISLRISSAIAFSVSGLFFPGWLARRRMMTL